MKKSNYVIKRNGREEKVSFDKVLKRIENLSDTTMKVDPYMVAQKTISGIFPGVNTRELDSLAAEISAHLSTLHPDYDTLASRISISNLQKETSDDFVNVMEREWSYINPKTKKSNPLISRETLNIAKKHRDRIQSTIDYSRDFRYNYFGFKTLENKYLCRIDGKIIERPQHMLMRVAIGIHGDDIESILETYNYMSIGAFTHATPTLFNAGTERPQMSSCFLMTIKDDLENIYSRIGDCATISKYAGGIGVSIHSIRSDGSFIGGTNGSSNGIVPMLRVLNETARYVDQCFHPSTQIYNYGGGLTKISELKINDSVITEGGMRGTVSKILKYNQPSSRCYKIKTKNSSVVVTDQHQLLSLRTPATHCEWSDIESRIDAGLYIVTWNDVSTLEKNDFLVFPKSCGLSLDDGHKYGDNIFVKIESIEDDYYSGPVYDLEIDSEDDKHSYTTQIGVAHNGGGKRKGAIAVYLEVWHADIEDFLQLKTNSGSDDKKARDLFYGLWVCDLFFKRIERDEMFSLFCPNECPGLDSTWGEEFEELYLKYEREGRYKKQIPAKDLYKEICFVQIETSQPYMLYKDACNRKSNQQNLGTIRSSNLCTEIVEYTSDDEIAVCNLASVALPWFVVEDGDGGKSFDFGKLHDVVKVVTKNLNRVIDRNFYPLEQTKTSNLRHRPVGIGVQGLADAFLLLGYPYESEEAQELNRKIFATIYHAALEKSNELSMVDGPYSSFKGSPSSRGLLQFDLWGEEPGDGMYDWDRLKESIREHGLRNSLLVAPMPTATTAQILGNSESFEPYVSNIYLRKVVAGGFVVVNKHLVRELESLGLWSEYMKDKIIAHKGSVRLIDEIPENIKNKYKTAWEISVKTTVDMAADRGKFIDQSQSFNAYFKDVSVKALSAFHYLTWKKGLKTGVYYIRSQPSVDAIPFTIDHNMRVDAEKMIYDDKNRKVGDSKKDENDEFEQLEQFVCMRGSDCEACQ